MGTRFLSMRAPPYFGKLLAGPTSPAATTLKR
jgi:hypothetical protein